MSNKSLFSSLILLWGASLPAAPSAPPSAQLLKLPLAFEQRQNGGADEYRARGERYSVSLHPTGVEIGVLPGPNRPANVVSIEFAGARRSTATPSEMLPGKVNYIQGRDPRSWQLGLPTFRRIVYEGVYPGIDVAYYGAQSEVEFDLMLKPGADPRKIRMNVRGADQVSVTANGALLIHTAGGDVSLPLPTIYQGDAGGRKNVAGRYKLQGKNQIGFELSDYDRSKTLTIDPTIVYASLFGGGTNSTFGRAVAVDTAGNAYVAGYTYASDFPTANAASSQLHVGPDGFVTKIDPTGTTMLYSTYIGGASSDQFNSIAVDSTGAAWIAGNSNSVDFPVAGAYQSQLNGSQNAVVVKLSPAGAIQYSTYFGTGSLSGRAVAVDSSGNAYMAGYVSGTSTVPVTAGVFQSSSQGSSDAFASKFSSAGALLYSTYLGGSSNDYAFGVAVDSSGNAYIAGYSSSTSWTDAPGGGAQTTNHGSTDAFVAKLNATGTALSAFTFLGGASGDYAQGIAVDGAGNAYVGGFTISTDFPATNGAYQTASAGSWDGFVAKFSPTLSAVTYATYLGGGRYDQVYGIAVDSSGNAYVTGFTESAQFPTVAAVQPAVPGNTTTLFKTANSGGLWSVFDGNMPGQVTDVFPDPVTPGVIVVATDLGMYQSSNGGGTWTMTLSGNISWASRSLANSSTIYAMTGSFSYRSTDGGATWNTSGSVGRSGGRIVADPLTASTAYVAGAANTVYKTIDGGATWTPINTGLSSNTIQSLIASPDGALYMDASNTIYKSTNQGASWTTLTSGVVCCAVLNGLAVSQSNPSVLYRVTNNNAFVYASVNGGATWTTTTGALPAGISYSVAVSPTNSAVVYASTVNPPGLYLSNDSGATWGPVAGGLGVAAPIRMVVDGANTANAYAVANVTYSGFAAKLNATGTGLVYSSVLAASNNIDGYGIAVASNGDAIIAGDASGVFGWTTTNWPSGGSSTQGFVARITDATAACAYAVTPAAQTTYSSAALLTFAVRSPSGCAWTASSDQTWATVASGASGAASGLIFVNVSANTTGSPRTAVLTIGGQTATITQAPSSCSYSLSPNSISLPSSGGPVSVNVNTGAGCPWTVTDNYPVALTINSGASGTGSGTVNMTVAASAAQSSRSLFVPIANSSVTITQAGYCTYTVTPGSPLFDANGGVGSVAVSTQAGCAWSASGTTWLTITSGSPGVGNGTVNYSVAANTGIGRSFSFSVGNQTVKVTQMPPQAYLISTFAGGQNPATALAATAAALPRPFGTAVDAGGNVYFTSILLHSVFQLDPSGNLTRIAGAGVAGYSGDGGPALAAQLNNPRGIAVDTSGNVYVSDAFNHRIRKIATDGTITTVAGIGTSGFSGDGGAATSAQLNFPYGLAIDSAGNLYVADTSNSRIRKISGGTITTLAGTGSSGFSGDNGSATSAQLFQPWGVAVDASGNVYIADSNNQRIRKIAGGTITTLAGTGSSGFSGDNGSATSAQVNFPIGVAVDALGNVYVSDTNSNRIRVINGAGVITTVAGTGSSGFLGDGGPSASAQLYNPYGIAVDAAGSLYFADFFNSRIRKVTPGRTITTIAGGSPADGGQALFAGFAPPFGVARDSAGNLYVADTANHRIRKITPAGLISTFAGTGVSGFSGDNGPAASAQLNFPQGVSLDASGNVYIADTSNNRIRKVATDGTITTFAGTGSCCYSGDNGPATSAWFNSPSRIAMDSAGNLFIADTSNHRIRKVSSGGTITTVAGTGTSGFSGDNGPAVNALLNNPRGLTFDAAGNLYIADSSNHRIRMMAPNGTITTVAGTGTSGFSGDGGSATSANLNTPYATALDSAGNLFIADSNNNRIREVTGGIILTVAGTGSNAVGGDGGAAINGTLGSPFDLVLDATGHIYFSDNVNSIVRLLTPVETRPLLTITGNRNSGLTAGGSGSFTLTVGNAPFAGATSGTVTLSTTIGAGFTLTDLSGSGWNCVGATCTRSDSLPAGGQYPVLTASLTVAATLPWQITNRAVVSGGGSAAAVIEDTIDVLPNPPAEPVLISPANAATGVALSTSLTWSAANGAASYDVYFGTSTPPPFAANTASTSYSPAGIVAGSTYYWQVVAKSAAHSAYSAQWSFTAAPAGNCTYSLGAAGAALQTSGGAGSVVLTTAAGCPWTASSNQAWLVITSSTSGVGSGSVSYSAGANTGAARSATLTIGGQTFQVSQSAPYLISSIVGGVMPLTAASGASLSLAMGNGVVIDATGNVYFPSPILNAVFKVDNSGAVTRVAGTGVAGFSGDNGSALAAQLNNPNGIAIDASGNLYIADTTNSRIRKIDTAGTITTIAGNGCCYSGDNGPATSALMNGPYAVALDSAGNLYITESGQRIRKVSGGIITTFAGTGNFGFSGDTGPATSAQINNPHGIVVDASGNVYFADANNNRIRKIDTGGTITTIAGTNICCTLGDGGAALSAWISQPAGLALDAAGSLYIADSNNASLRKISGGIITTVAGFSTPSFGGDGGAATSAGFNGVVGVAVDPSGALYIADGGNNRLRRVSPGGIVTTIVGGYTGDGGAAALAGIQSVGIARDSAGNTYIADSFNHRVRRIAIDGTITTIAGTGIWGFSGDNGPGGSAQLKSPTGVAIDAAGNVYIADSGNQRIRKLTAGGTITTVAGNGNCCFSGDGGPATSANLNNPQAVAIDAAGNLYIADDNNHRIRKVTAGGTITTLAGTGTSGYSGDTGQAAAARLNFPSAIALDTAGNVYIADTSNQRVRKVDTSGVITTVAGNGNCCYSGDNGAATSAMLNSPSGLAVDAAGNLFIADRNNQRVRRVDTTGTITTLAGNGGFGFFGDGGVATNANFRNPVGITMDAAGNLYVADTNSRAIRLLTPAGTQPLLSINSTHGGVFAPSSAAQYTVTVFNAAAAAGTSGTVTVTDTLPTGLTLNSMTGTGWNCVANSCTRSDVLAPGASYPAITVAVNVGAVLPLQLTNQAIVSGGGAATQAFADLTLIGGTVPAVPVLISPANNAAGVALTASLTWGAANGAASYDVYFGTSTPPPFATNTTSTSYAPAGIVAGTTYYWQVVAKSSAHSAYSAVWSFTAVPAVSCTYSLSAANAAPPASGGTGSVGLTTSAGCPWTASSNQTWLVITSSTSGTGSATVSYSVVANTGAPRNASLTIGGQTFQVSQSAPYLISSIAGGVMPPTSAPGATVSIPLSYGVAIDATGNVYFPSPGMNAVFKVDNSGIVTRVAGTGVAGFSGDSGPALAAQLNNPSGIAIDASGNLYVADLSNNRIRKIDTAGTITTFAGNGCCFGGDNGPATSAFMNSPYTVALDSAGNLYIAEGGQRIRKVSGGIITTFAGTGASGFSGDNGLATNAAINNPRGIVIDASGNVYFSDSNNNRVRKIDTGGTITTFAGSNICCTLGDGGPAASAWLSSPAGLALDGAGSLYIADSSNAIIRKVSNGVIATVAGFANAGFFGDGGVATSAQFNGITGVAVDPSGALYIADAGNNRLRRVSPGGIVTTLVGGYTGDSGLAPLAGLQPSGIARDSAGNLYIAETSNHRVRKIAPNGVITTIAGTGVSGVSGDNGPGSSAQLKFPNGVAVDAAGNVYIADGSNNRVRKVSPGGTITTVAGNGNCCFSGDGGPATNANLNTPRGVTIDAAGNLYIADSNNNRVRKVTAGGTITTVAGNGTGGYSGDNGQAAAAQLSSPNGVALDAAGNLYIADMNNQRVRKVDTSGVITTVAGNGFCCYSGDNGPATSANMNSPSAVVVDAGGNLFIADRNNERIRRVDTTGTIATVAGNGGLGFFGDGGIATNANLNNPAGIALDSAGNLYVADQNNRAIRLLTPAATQPLLSITSSHAGVFNPSSAAQYTVTVSNASAAAGTSGTVTVTETLPTGLTLSSMTGTGWNCAANSCTRSDVLQPGASYPAITVAVNVAAALPLQVSNQAIVSGGGATAQAFADLTLIGGTVPAVPVLISPANNATGVALTTSVTWGAATGATSYDVYFGTSTPPPFAVNTTSTSYAPAGLVAGTTYYWQIVANSGVHTSGSAIWSFTAIPAVSCSYSLSAAGTVVSAAGGTGSVSVTAPAGCSWTASSNQNWLAVSSGASGIGNGAVGYTAGGNTASVPRTATLTIGGQTFTVSQGVQYILSTVAGRSLPSTGVQATTTALSLNQSYGVATDSAGNVYFASPNLNSVFKLNTAGVLTRAAGTGAAGFFGDGGPAANAQLSNPQGVAVDASGNLYIADSNNRRIRKVDTTGVITTVAGNGSCCFSGDTGPATGAALSVINVAVDSSGNLYSVETTNRVRKISGGIITTVAGTGASGFSGDGALAINAQLAFPTGAVADGAGNLYIADQNNRRVRKINTSGLISTIAGTNVCCDWNDGGQAAAAYLDSPSGLALDGAGNVLIADANSESIRKVTPGGLITTIAGGAWNAGFSGDSGAATNAQLLAPRGVAVDPAGNLLILDTGNNRIRKVATGTLTITTVAGGASRDGSSGVLGGLNQPTGVARDAAGNLYIADTNNHRVRKLAADGTLTTIAGTGISGYSGDNGPAVSALLNRPYSVALDAAGNIYIADTGNARIRKIGLTGTITTVAGTGSGGFSGDTGPATAATLSWPQSIAIDTSGNLYIADWGNDRVRKVTAGGTITTVAGNGQSGFSGDGAQAAAAQLNYPYSVAVDAAGSLYIADYYNQRVRKVTTGGVISTVAGTGACCDTGDLGPATAALLNYPTGVAVDSSGGLWISEQNGNRVRRVDSGGIITAAAGFGGAGFSGDGSAAVGGAFRSPVGMAFDAAGNVYVADLGNDAIRMLTPAGAQPVLTTAVSHSGTFTGGATGTYTITVTNAALAGPTSGQVNLTELLPAGLTLASMIGSGWSCNNGICGRSDALAGGSSYPSITVTTNVSGTAPSQGTNQVVLSGGAAAVAGAWDGTVVSTPVLTISKTHTGNFAQGQNNAAYTVTVGNSGTGPTSGTVTMTETVPSGLTLVGMAGTGWACSVAQSTCTRSDALAAGSSYPTIAVTVNVAANATSPQVNSVMASGGGSVSASTTDSTSLAAVTAITVTTSPAGLSIVVDGTTYTAPQTFNWTPASNHTINVNSQGAGTRYVFSSWSDSGAQSHTVVTPGTTTTYTATFATQYLLTLTASPGAGGVITASPSSADGYYSPGTSVRLTASPAAGFGFTVFSGDVTGGTNPQNVVLSAPRTVTATFPAIGIAPVAISVTPSSGSGSVQTFSATFGAANGYHDLQWVQMLIAVATDGGGQSFCFLHYDVNGNGLWLYSDVQGFFKGPIAPGTQSNLLQGSACALNTSASTVVGNGINLTLNANVVFKGAGARNVYMRAMTQAQADTGWTQRGTWTTSAAALGTATVGPASGTGATQTFTLTYPDPPGFAGAAFGWAQFLVGAAADGGGQPFCFLHYDRGGNGLWMYSGDVGYFVGPVSPGTASNALSSSACSINTAGATVSNTGGNLVVTVPITMKAPMSGSKKTFQRTLDVLNRDTGWQQTGTWIIP